jgi:hypothetical protein
MCGVQTRAASVGWSSGEGRAARFEAHSTRVPLEQAEKDEIRAENEMRRGTTPGVPEPLVGHRLGSHRHVRLVVLACRVAQGEAAVMPRRVGNVVLSGSASAKDAAIASPIPILTLAQANT